MSEVKKHVRIPPNDTDAEQATLGSIMLNPSALNDIIDLVQAETFYSEKHRIIFKAMIDLFSKNEPIDILSLSTSLKNREQLEQVGGRTYLTDLTNSVPASTNVKHYAKIVYRKNLMRKLIEAGEHLANVGFSESDEDVETLMDEAEKKVFAITGDPKGQNFVSLKQSLLETWDHLEKLHDAKDGGLGGVPTGYPTLDNLLGGLHRSDLIILAARPSVGKTTLALDIARNAAVKSGIPVGIFSLEMSAQQLTQRMLSAQAHVDAWKLRTGKLTAEADFQKIRDSMNELSKAPIYIDDQAGNSIIKMKSVARRLKSEFGLGLIVVDYLQLMTTSKNYDSMVNQVTEISRRRDCRWRCSGGVWRPFRLSRWRRTRPWRK
jgi:replicative DNA helicase